MKLYGQKLTKIILQEKKTYKKIVQDIIEQEIFILYIKIFTLVGYFRRNKGWTSADNSLLEY